MDLEDLPERQVVKLIFMVALCVGGSGGNPAKWIGQKAESLVEEALGPEEEPKGGE